MATETEIIASIAAAVQAGDLSDLSILADLLRDLDGPGKTVMTTWAMRPKPLNNSDRSKKRARVLRSVILWATDRPAWDAREAERKAKFGTSGTSEWLRQLEGIR